MTKGLSLLLWVMVAGGIVTAANAPPNLVFILLDDMGYNDFYSSSDIHGAWPHVRELAEDRCIRVENYYTQQLCSPSRGAFMTGRYPVRLGLQHRILQPANQHGLPLDEETLPQKLRRVGYNTVGVGKWHLGHYNNASIPTNRGFNNYFGYYAGGEDYYTHTIRVERQGPYLDLHDGGVIQETYNGTYSLDLFLNYTLKHIENHALYHHDSPLFLYVALQNVHAPLEVPEIYTESEPCASIDDSDRKTFCGMANAADLAIHKITELADEKLKHRDTIIILSGDNGGESISAGNNCPKYDGGLCLRGGKSSLYEGGVRNLALLCSKTRVPSRMKNKTYSKGLVHITDWHATFLHLGDTSETLSASDSVSKSLDGMNVFDAITGNRDSPRKDLLVNYDPCSARNEQSCDGTEEYAYVYKGCINGDCGIWKYHLVPDNGHSYKGWIPVPTDYECRPLRFGCEAPSSWAGNGTPTSYMRLPADILALDVGDQLFNLASDPNEEDNVAAKYPDVLAELKEKVSAIMSESDILQPCNIPGGTCASMDPAALLVFATDGVGPWVSDLPSLAVV